MFEAALMRGDGLDGLRLLLVLLSLAAALGYLLIESRPPSTLRTGLKTAAIGLWVPLPLLALPGAIALPLALLALAFLLSSAGDLFLAMKDNPRNFQRGLLAFLATHLFYLAIILPLASRPEGLVAGAASLLTAAGALALYFWLRPNLGSSQLPVAVYLVTILFMALAALAIPAAQPWLGLGAVLFVISDGVIAADKFGRPIPFRGLIVWTTYYAGQALMGLSLLALLR
ncbi:MAG: lysoplasmalogenase [Parvibaculum sp.]|uniref:lysoplasmalogenase n=1 Tax=Parvibaculum sp. TaxID=2024848 RepID=UPI0027278B54|nr:lysoplasmalogenase [Parvibaculum sp.]MDO8838913.1 lysoplasmalogenase [Parvibaculum sp.]